MFRRVVGIYASLESKTRFARLFGFCVECWRPRFGVLCMGNRHFLMDPIAHKYMLYSLRVGYSTLGTAPLCST